MFTICLLALASLLFLSGPVRAQTGAPVAIGGETLFTIYASAQGKTAEERADAVTGRLPDILGDSTLTALDIVLVPNKDGSVAIMVKRRLLITVTPADGKRNGKTALQQAQTWAQQARRVLPSVNAQPNPQQIETAAQAVSGTVTYRQRIALPPAARLEVTLLDVSNGDGPAVIVSQKTITPHSQVPIPFSLPFTLKQIDPDHSYAVEARIVIGGKAKWFTPKPVAVITQGHPRRADLVLQSTGH